MAIKFTDKTIKRKGPEKGSIVLWDSIAPGLALRINAGGKRSYFVMPRVNGKQVKFKLGSTELLPLVEARVQARRVFENAAKGIPPKQAKQTEIIAMQRAQRNTFRWVAEHYMENRKRQRSIAWTKDLLERDAFPAWGNRPISEITRDEVEILIDAKGKTVAANRLLATVRAVFNWAIKRRWIEVNPAGLMDSPAEEKPRDRALSDAELKRVWDALGSISSPTAQLVKLMILTGQRRSEIASLKWLDLDSDGNWIISAEDTKADRKHLVPLAPLAVKIIRSCPKRKGWKHVFATRSDKAPSGWSKLKSAIDTEIAKRLPRKEKQEAWTFHDLRRTVRSGLSRLKVRPDIAERIVGHKVRDSLIATYDVYDYAEEKRHGLELWANHVASVVSNQTKTTNVVPLRRARA